MLNQKLQLRLVQKLSPQQVLVMRLLQEPLLSLEQRIKQEIEENPALELEGESQEEEEKETLMDEPILDSIDSDEDEFRDEYEEEQKSADNEFSVEDYVEDDEIPDYRLIANNKSPDEEIQERPLRYLDPLEADRIFQQVLILPECVEFTRYIRGKFGQDLLYRLARTPFTREDWQRITGESFSETEAAFASRAEEQKFDGLLADSSVTAGLDSLLSTCNRLTKSSLFKK